jgi:FAD/FMN-containing dehydrogenase/Fe-S oxidoreductase
MASPDKRFGDIACAIHTDDLTRQLHATDASAYQIVPRAVAFPRSPEQTREAIQAARAAGMPVTPRGAGTGLAGGALGDGLILELCRHNRRISEFNRDARTVRVDPGVVLDQLNAFLKPHGLIFGPDVATSSRATLGGMIANDSSGARTPRYGTTAAHIRSLDLVLSDGTITTIGRDHDKLRAQRSALERIVQRHAQALDQYFPPGILKRWPAYGLDAFRRADMDLTRILAGSEGTLAAITSAELRVVPLPAQRGLALIFFASVAEAMQATVELLDLEPVAIEHIDRVLFEQTRGQLQFATARALLELDEKPCEAILIVEFFEDIQDRLERVRRRNLGLRTSLYAEPASMDQVWLLRKAGLSLLTGRKGPAKPTAGVEDAAVLPARLPEYVTALQRVLERLGLEASFYGHAASGLLHVRPVVDMHDPRDIAKFRELADEVSALVKQFKGSIAAEHGVGIARTEFLADHLGTELMDAMREVKALFDPDGVMNPGKILGNGAYRIDTNLRQGPAARIALPWEPVLAFAAKDESFIGNLEQCNGNGACRKYEPTMCPTYLATGEEIMSTRGRANTIRAVLEHRLAEDWVNSAALYDALSNCVSCKACKTECPSNVDMALLKAEVTYAQIRRRGLTLRERILSRPDRLGRLGSIFPRVANYTLRAPWARRLIERTIGIAARRPLPPYVAEPFDQWFRKRSRSPQDSPRGTVLLWDDCFVRHNEPDIGKAAVTVLEAAGYDVNLVHGRVCCGRPAFSTGRLDLARDFGAANLALLENTTAPIVFLEPSCYTMFAQDYRELTLPQADAVRQRCLLFEDFILALLEREPEALPFRDGPLRVAIHGHCHAKSSTPHAVKAAQLARQVPMAEVQFLDTGCCGMAGAFGALREKYELSIQMGALLKDALDALPGATTLVASGTSCRHQIQHLTNAHPLHMAQLLAARLKGVNDRNSP